MKKQVLELLMATGLAQLMTICAVPLLTRLYSPEEFGLFGVFVACIGVIGNAATLRYELAIVIPEARQEAAPVLALCLPVSALMALGTLVLVWTSGDDLAQMLGHPGLESLLWWLPLSVLTFGGFQSLNYWATRDGRFREVGVIQIARAGIGAAAQVALGMLGATAVGLVVGQVAAHVAVTAAWFLRIWKRDGPMLREQAEWSKIKIAAVQFRSFPQRSAPQALINSFSQSLPFFLIGILFSPTIAGLYLLAQRVVQAPVQLVASSLSQVLLPRYARFVNERISLAPDLFKLSIWSLLITAPAIPASVILGERFFAWAFGVEWSLAGNIAAWMTVAKVLELVIPPATSVLTVLERQGLQLAFEVVMLVFRSAALMLGSLWLGPVGAIAALSLAEAVMNFSLALLGYFVARQHDARELARCKVA